MKNDKHSVDVNFLYYDTKISEKKNDTYFLSYSAKENQISR